MRACKSRHSEKKSQKRTKEKRSEGWEGRSAGVKMFPKFEFSRKFSNLWFPKFIIDSIFFWLVWKFWGRGEHFRDNENDFETSSLSYIGIGNCDTCMFGEKF